MLQYIILFAAAFASEAEKRCPPCTKFPLFDIDFTHCNLPIRLSDPDPNWSYFGNPEIGLIANGGTLKPGTNGVVQDSSVYYRYYPQSPIVELPRLQYIIYANDPVYIEPVGRTIFETKMSVENLRTFPNPFPANMTTGPNDARFASAGSFIIDLETFLVFNYYVTNDWVYAAYARLSVELEFIGPFAVFTYLVPVARRRVKDMNKLELIVDSDTREIVYRVDCREVWRVANVGSRLPSREFMVKDLAGPDRPLWPARYWYGFGCSSLIDAYAPCGNGVPCPLVNQGLSQSASTNAPPQYNPKVGFPTLATYWDPNGLNEYWVYGQGSRYVVESIKITRKIC